MTPPPTHTLETESSETSFTSACEWGGDSKTPTQFQRQSRGGEISAQPKWKKRERVREEKEDDGASHRLGLGPLGSILGVLSDLPASWAPAKRMARSQMGTQHFSCCRAGANVHVFVRLCISDRRSQLSRSCWATPDTVSWYRLENHRTRARKKRRSWAVFCAVLQTWRPIP